MRWNLSYSYLDLPELFYTEQPAGAVARPSLSLFNHRLAADLGLGALDGTDLAILAGNASPPGGRTFAQAYAGHQYGHFTMLGDGRALVLGEHSAPDGLRDLQLKGSGRTPYSRRGDGRASLGPMLREYLMGEALHALGIPTTRALAVVETGEPVLRETALPGAVLTRVARSHLRVGTFEYASAAEDLDALRALVDYALARHYPSATRHANPAQALLAAVVAAQARLIAQWMAVGFVHGVMNTDNMAVSGESIDFGPCAFLDAYGPSKVFSSIDQQGRYSYGNQPGIARWNLTRLAEALLPVLHPDQESAIAIAQPLIDGFAPLYETHYYALMASKFGLAPEADSRPLVEGLLARMEEAGADYTLTFRSLASVAKGAPLDLPDGEAWAAQWRPLVANPEAQARLAASNPVYIPRNQHVESALDAAVGGDLGPFESLVDLLRTPFDAREGYEQFERAPKSETPFVTYCGT